MPKATSEGITAHGIKTSGYAVRTLEMAMPVGTMTYGLLTKDNKLLKSGLEAASSRVISVLMSEAYKRLADRNNTGITYADYAYRYPTYSQNLSSRQAACAFATAASLSMQYKKWYVVVPVYAYASSVACTSMYINKECTGNVVTGIIVGTASGLAAHWLTKKLLPNKEKNCLAGW